MGDRTALVVAVVLVLVLPGVVVGESPGDPTSPGHTPGVAASADDAADGAGAPAGATRGRAPVEITYRYELTPDRPGRVRVTIEYDIAERVGSIPTVEEGGRDGPRLEVLSAEGFDRSTDDGGPATYTWDGETATPRITAVVHANRSTAAGVESADTGEWAFLRAVERHWTYRSNPDVSVRVEADVPVVRAPPWVFLGEHRSRTETVAGRPVRLVRPPSVRPGASTDGLFDVLDGMATNFGPDGGDRVTGVLLPRPFDGGGAEVTTGNFWAATGGPAEFLQTLRHEYVHVRQDYRASGSAQWTVEAFPEYFATLQAWRAGTTTFRGFRARLDGTDNARDVLAAPGGWNSSLTPYTKGETVAAGLDYRIRRATGGRRTLADVLARLNGADGPVDDARLRRAVEAVAGQPFDDYFETYVSGRSVPPPPPDPGVYSFYDPRPLRGTLATDAGTTPAGAVLAIPRGGPGVNDTDVLDVYAVTGFEEPVRVYAWNVSPDGRFEAPLRRDVGYDLAYLQRPGDRRTFPVDGVPDLYALDVEPVTAGEVRLPAGSPVRLSVAGPVGGSGRAGLVVESTNGRSGVGLRVPVVDGRPAVPGRSGAVELAGEVRLFFVDAEGAPATRARPVTLRVERPTSVRLVGRASATTGVAAVAVPTGNATAGRAAGTARVGTPLTVEVYLHNDADAPRTVSVPVTVDGERRGTVERSVAPESVVRAETAVEFTAPGTPTVRVGKGAEFVISVSDADPTTTAPATTSVDGSTESTADTGTATTPADTTTSRTTAADDEGGDGQSQPGFGVALAVVALAAGLLAARRRR